MLGDGSRLGDNHDAEPPLTQADGTGYNACDAILRGGTNTGAESSIARISVDVANVILPRTERLAVRANNASLAVT